MSKAYIFDWGDTLMVDFQDSPGPMKDWDYVEAVPGAEAALKHLSSLAPVYVATSSDSPPQYVAAALSRVNLSQYISGYFSPVNTGYTKIDPGFYQSIAAAIGLETNEITMIGDSFLKDVEPPLNAGMNAIWFNTLNADPIRPGIKQVQQLSQLC